MSIMHRRRAVLDRAAAANGKRKSQPVEFERASELPPVDHERPAASSRSLELAQTPASVPQAKPAKKKAKRAKR